MTNYTINDNQKRILERIKRIIDLQFRGYREGKYTSRRTYRSVVHAYARYIVLQRGKMDLVIDLDDVQSYLIDLVLKGRTESYISVAVSALKYYTRKVYGKDSKVLHQLDRLRPTTEKESM